MLSLLRISNYAIIDDIEIEMRSGFSVMTGETGAGKSILVDALGLCLGDRADAGAVRSGSDRAEINLVFELEAGHPARAWLAEHDLDDELCCLRRTISADGRSRAFVNNRPVALKDLREIGNQLVDIHGQHEHQSLLKAAAQRQLLDAGADLDALADQVAGAFTEWQAAEKRRSSGQDAQANRDAELDLLRFQLTELEALELAPDEPRSLRDERGRLRHVDQLQQGIAQAAEAIYESESFSAQALAARAHGVLASLVEHDSELNELVERLAGAEVELREVGGELSRRIEALESDPARLEEVEARLYLIQRLARRHRMDEDELPTVADKLREKIRELDASAESAAALDARCEAAARHYGELAANLSKSRHAAAGTLSATATQKLRELGLPDAEFVVSIMPKPPDRHDSTGIDRIVFEVTTNAGEPPGPIDRIASGGELSRMGLALAVVASGASEIPTLIFDEVDAGIGGAVAEVVGRRLKELSARHQVLCVTHLPQVASQGNHHYRIVKLTDGQSSRTQVRLLDSDQRVEELSRMLGGIEITAAARAHAEDMIRHAAGG